MPPKIRKMTFSGKTLYVYKSYIDNDEVLCFQLYPSSLSNPRFTISLLNKNVFKVFVKAQNLRSYVYNYGDIPVLESYGGCIRVIKETWRTDNTYTLAIYTNKNDLNPFIKWNRLTKYQVRSFFYMILMMISTKDTEIVETFTKTAK